MYSKLLEIPEIQALDGPSGLIRIPNQIDVPVTPRLLRIIDTAAFQRLSHISQLGVVSFVYPAANHTRFEHSLGVYRMSLLFLKQLSHQPVFANVVSPHDATVLILAALLHDIGHWPFCHPIEDMRLGQVPEHEEFCDTFLNEKEISACLAEDWAVSPNEIIRLIKKQTTDNSSRILCSVLSGPIDIDKMDYLYRDSLHAGVPYGQNFDAPRLIRSLCLNAAADRLAITHKGKTAAELMVFARYIMFSEVYWHHAVRSATAMFQRAFYLWYRENRSATDFRQRIERLFRLREVDFIAQMKSPNLAGCSLLLDALFGRQRRLYKRVANYSCFDGFDLYRELAQRPYEWLVECSRQLAQLLADRTQKQIDPIQILIDAPPVGLEVQFEMEVFSPRENAYRSLGELSPVVKTLAQRQFDDFVKQVRIFVAPEIQNVVDRLELEGLLHQAIARTDALQNNPRRPPSAS